MSERTTEVSAQLLVETEHLVFVNPKGLHHFDPADPKVQFATFDIPRLQQIIDTKAGGPILSAFIISPTTFSSLGWSKAGRIRMSKSEIEELGVLFQADDPGEYIATMMRRIAGGQRSAPEA